MSLFADICRDSYADDSEIEFDEDTKTWTIKSCFYLNEPFREIPDKELALAIARALYKAYELGIDTINYS